MMRRILLVGLPLVILVLAAAGAWALWKTRPEPGRRPAAEKIWIVDTLVARFGDERPMLRLFGEVVAGRKVVLRPLVAGPVVAVGPQFVAGGVVAKDALLVAIDPFEYRAAVSEREADLAEAQARLREYRADYKGTKALLENDKVQVEIRRRDVRRREKLRGAGATSAKALDDTRLALSESELRLADRRRTVAIWQARIAQQKAAVERARVALRRARRDLADTRLLAPFDGFLKNVSAEIGKRLGVGDPVAEVIDAGRLEVRFHVGNKTFARLRAAPGGYRGRPVRVFWRGSDDAAPFEATLAREEAEIETASGGVNLYARLRDVSPESGLRPGAFVRLATPDLTYRNVARIPDTALYDGDTVYVVVNGRLAPRRVRVVARTGGDVLVRGDLTDGEAVLITRFPEIGPGVRVTVR